MKREEVYKSLTSTPEKLGKKLDVKKRLFSYSVDAIAVKFVLIRK